jgi:hypothetical protein
MRERERERESERDRERGCVSVKEVKAEGDLLCASMGRMS